jgi:hypothetical protein
LHLVFNPFFVLIIFIAIVLSFSWFVFFFSISSPQHLI